MSSEAESALPIPDARKLTEILGEYLRYLEFRKAASKTTLITYTPNLRDFLGVIGDMPAEELTMAHIDQYATVLSFRPIKPKTYRNKLVIVKGFIRYMYNHNLTLVNPELVELPKDAQSEANFLDDKEQKKLLSVVKNERDRAMVLVLLSSGLRVTELTNLHISDVYKRSVAVRNGKGNKPRVTFITPEAEKAIKLYLRDTGRQHGYLFPNPAGNPMSRALIARKVNNYAHKAGFKKHVTTHTLRHSFATTLLKRGARLEDVQHLLGHTNLKTTMIYLHFTNYDLQRSYNKVMLKR